MTQKSKIIQIAVSIYEGESALYGLDAEGNVWYQSYYPDRGPFWELYIPHSRARGPDNYEFDSQQGSD